MDDEDLRPQSPEPDALPREEQDATEEELDDLFDESQGAMQGDSDHDFDGDQQNAAQEEHDEFVDNELNDELNAAQDPQDAVHASIEDLGDANSDDDQDIDMEAPADEEPAQPDEMMEDFQDHSHQQVQELVEDVLGPAQELDDFVDAVAELANADEQAPIIQDQEDDNDTSLFIPEERASTPPRAQPAPSNMPPPPRPVAQPLTSTFAKIRRMQQMHKLKQNRANASASRQSHQAMPDDEAYLEAVQSSGVARQASVQPEITMDYDKEDKKALAAYQAEKRKYDGFKRANGKLNFREQIEWMKIARAEEVRKAKRKRDLQIAQEDGEGMDLFPDFGFRSNVHETQLDQDDADDVDPSSVSDRRRLAMPSKPLQELSMAEAELRSMYVALDAEPDLPKKKRKGSDEDSQDQPSAGSSARSRGSRSKGTKTKPKPRRKATTSTSAKQPRQSAKKRKETEKAIRQATSLFNSDVFTQQAAQGAPDQPTFTKKNKKDALQELIASVPTEFLQTARGDSAALLQATRDFDGHGSVKAHGGMWRVKGMATSLKAYQVMGSAFMRRRENDLMEPRGGLVADQMGLGKTLMMLANIVNGHPGKHAECKTTLLIATPALITQWAKEIDLHTDFGLMVMRYSSGSRIDSNSAEQILKSHDIILTTYTEILNSYPKNEPPIDCQTAEQKIDWWKKQYAKHRGVLHRLMFHRVVLDEAQAIKNHTSRTSIACRALMAKHKWALSGTPILNALSELYPYFKFLGVPHTGSFKIFKHNYCGTGDTENQERLLVRLSQFMIRRTHEDTMFGAPILKLPQADQQTHWCTFNAVERAIYEIVRQRFAKHINMLAKKGTLEKSYSNALVMLLRLRQLTSHVLLLQSVMQDLLEREDIEAIRDVVKKAAADSSTQRGKVIIALRKQLDDFQKKEMKRTAAKNSKHPIFDLDEAEDVQDEIIDEDGINYQTGRKTTGGNFGKDYNFKPFLNSLATGEVWEQKKKKSSCGSCSRSPPLDPFQTSCGHLLCALCYEEAQLLAAEQDLAHTICGSCGKVFIYARRLSLEEEEDMAGPQTRSKGKQRADKHQAKIADQDISEEWLNLGGEGVLPSAKTIAIKAQLMNWFEGKEASSDGKPRKVIIYTQFLAMIRILAKVCQEEGWQTEQYHGKMSHTARDKAIQDFADKPNIRVLLASLRCGGLGLNLTMASRVIIIDPWWNSAAEQQAFCRVFRFGQRETTFLTKFCVKNTVDERLIDMQEKKQKEIDEVMDDKNKTARSLGLRDLMRLFGNLQEDDQGMPFIMVDNPDSRGGFRADSDHEGFADEI